MADVFSGPGGLGARVGVGLVTAATVVTVCRIFTRFILIRKPGLEDWAIMGAVTFSILQIIFFGLQIKNGTGKPVEAISPNDLRNLLQDLWFTIIWYNLALTSTKVSIILQIHRVFVTKGFRRAIYFVFTAIIIFGLWALFSGVFACVPVHAYWDLGVAKKKCFPLAPLWYSNAGFNIVTDLAVFILPLPMIKSLQLPKREKLALMSIFALGLFVVITSAVRLISLHRRLNGQDASGLEIATWSAVEVNVGIICASLPTLRPLLLRLFKPRTSTASETPLNQSYRRSSPTQKPSMTASHISHGSYASQAPALLESTEKPSDVECQSIKMKHETV